MDAWEYTLRDFFTLTEDAPLMTGQASGVTKDMTKSLKEEMKAKGIIK